MNKLLLLSIVVFLFSCKSETAKNQAPAATPTVAEVPPLIPSDVLINLFENCTYIDFIFATLPFSISQDDKPSIQQTIANIAHVQPATIDPTCPYFAEQIFQIDGEIVLDAKIFFQQNCTYYLFYKDAELLYSASFNDAGIKFYNNIIKQANQTSNNG